jgi:hypothetical protein
MHESPENIDDIETEQRLRHIEELTQKLRKIAGGDFPMGFSDGCPLEVREKFLEHVLAFESRQEVSLFDELVKSGIDLPAPGTMNDEQLSRKLTETLRAMALMGAYLENTNHLSDRELYSRLVGEFLPEPTVLMPENPSYAVHLDVIGTGSPEDIQLYLRYYADRSTRRNWAREHPSIPMPKREPAPFDRDRHLPRPPERPVPKSRPA